VNKTANCRYAGVIHELMKEYNVIRMVMTITMVLFLLSILCALTILFVIYWRTAALLHLMTSRMGCLG
jgi:ABC-type bacteriocin/lantibiotic exporter with double-glycine peptidase domain